MARKAIRARMLALRPTAGHATQSLRGLSPSQLAWSLFWTGIAALYPLVFLRVEGVVPPATLAVVFVLFHAGLVASLAALLGMRRGWFAALLANGAPVALFWLAAWSIPAFLALYR